MSEVVTNNAQENFVEADVSQQRIDKLWDAYIENLRKSSSQTGITLYMKQYCVKIADDPQRTKIQDLEKNQRENGNDPVISIRFHDEYVIIYISLAESDLGDVIGKRTL